MGEIHPGDEAAPPAFCPFRVFFVPFYMPSHTIPMVDLACAFAARGVDATVLATPANGALIRRTVERAAAAGLPVRIVHYTFPGAVVGLAEGIENLATVPPGEEDKIYQATDAVVGALECILRGERANAVVADLFFPGLNYVTRDLGIPSVVFQGPGAFPLVVIDSLFLRASLGDNDNTPFLVPNIPDEVEMVKSEIPEFLRIPHYINLNMDKIDKFLTESFATVVNTFYDLEPDYCELYRRGEQGQPFFVGPYSLWSGNKDGVDGGITHNCLAWLDTQEEGSVVFVAFGSFNLFSKEQCWELAFGLEASGRPFLWVLKERDFAGDTGGLLPEGFEERVRGRGLVVKGWAPQVAILNHRATGAFVTHMGWNSLTEGLIAGVPMISWPLAYEQFINERFVVNILRLGLRLWDGFRSTLPEEAAGAVVKAEAISRVVARFLPPGRADQDIEAMRKRAREYRAFTRAAVKEGGAAYNDLTRLIDALKAFRPKAGDVGAELSVR